MNFDDIIKYKTGKNVVKAWNKLTAEKYDSNVSTYLFKPYIEDLPK